MLTEEESHARLCSARTCWAQASVSKSPGKPGLSRTEAGDTSAPPCSPSVPQSTRGHGT